MTPKISSSKVRAGWGGGLCRGPQMELSGKPDRGVRLPVSQALPGSVPARPASDTP